MTSVVSNGASASSFDRLVNRLIDIIDCNVGSFFFYFLWVNFAQFCSILLELLPLHLKHDL